MSLQIFCLLIEFVPPPEEQIINLAKENDAVKGILGLIHAFWKEDSVPAVLCTNEFQRLLNRIEGQQNYQFIFEGLSRLLSNFVSVKNSVLPDSLKELRCYSELIVLSLRIFTYNPVILLFLYTNSILLFMQ